jgi:hypothetical protein
VGGVGYEAFVGHVPDNGTVFILYSSHVGLHPATKQFGNLFRFN